MKQPGQDVDILSTMCKKKKRFFLRTVWLNEFSDGRSECAANVCAIHIFWSAQGISLHQLKRPDFFQTGATCSELPSNRSNMSPT